MVATTTTTKNTRNLRKVHSTHACSSRQEADDSAQRDYNLPIHSWKAITDDYERDDDNDDKKYEKIEGGNILVVDSG